jgi:hypothetical protein
MKIHAETRFTLLRGGHQGAKISVQISSPTGSPTRGLVMSEEARLW